MTLPTNFQFSQGSLQDYADCPRRFQLRYVLQLAWPALEAEPALENERLMQQGAAFHRLVHRHVLGISTEDLSRMVQEADLRRWWHNYLEHSPEDLPETRYPEIVLSAPVGGYRLVAKYDLVAVAPSAEFIPSPAEGLGAGAGQRAVIVDWKTSRKRPKHKYLAERLQTKVYPYLVVQAGAHLNGGKPLAPEQVEMIYWFADYPEDPAHFAYDAAQYEADEAYLASLIEEIAGLALSASTSSAQALSKGLDEGFPLTTQERRCKFCPYRSLCQRGVRAGALDEIEDELERVDFDVALDFEQIAEIEY